MTYKKERLINTFKIKAFIALVLLLGLGVLTTRLNVKTFAASSDDWEYKDDGYYYFKGSIVEDGSRNEVTVPSHYDSVLQYKNFEDNLWRDVPPIDLSMVGGGISYHAIKVGYQNFGSITIVTFYNFVTEEELTTSQNVSYRYNLRFKNPDTVAPVLSGETSYITSVDNPVTESTIRSGIIAVDNEDGDITDRIQLISDDYSPNKAKLGIYEIEYQVKDSADNVANLIVKVSVVDVTKPTITGTAKHTIGYNQTLSLSTIKSGLTATDNYDLTPTITLISDNYSTNKNRVGVYDVKYQAEDSSGNKSDVFTVTVTVVDTIKPTITGKNTYTAVYNNKLTIDSIKSELQAQDEHDGDITNNITLKSDGYSSNFNVKGNYQVIFTVSDASNNSVDYAVTVTVVDTIKPTITGKTNYVTGSTQKINESTIREALTAIDDYDGALNVALISDNYSSNYNIIGNYQIKYRATDASGNYMDYIVTVTVTDDVPPIFYVTDHFVNVDQALNMTLDEIIQHLILIGEISADTLNHYQITASNYMSSPGNYEIELSRKIDAPSTLNEKITIGVKVFESTEVPEPPTTPIEDDSELGFGDKFEAFFKEYGAYIVIGFIGLIVVLVVIKAINPSGRKRW